MSDTPYISPLYNVLTPYVLPDAGKMADVNIYKVRRDPNGCTQYYMPDRKVILVVECEDGTVYVCVEKK